MADRRQVEQRIKKKEQEIQSLEQQLKDARVYLQALQDVLRMFPKDATAASAEAALRPGSLVAQAREVILRRGQPMHVDEILKAQGKEINRANKTALGGSLSAYVRNGNVFTRPRPNTFGLIELEQRAEAAEPPADFGTDKPKKPQDDEEIPF